MWKSLNDALGDLVLLGSSSVTDDDEEGGGGDGEKDDEDGEAKTEEDDDDEEEEEGADWDAKEGGETMIGRMNSADDERGDHDVDGDTGEEVDCDESESEAIDDEEEEVLFLHSSPRSPRKHVALELESLDVGKMRRGLMEAEEQRNVLMQMVERRNEEICKLRCVVEQRRQRDSAIRHLEREVEWWNHMVAVCSEMTSTATDDSVNQRRVDSVNELKSIFNQMRGHGDAASDTADRSIGDSIKASEERIRELKSSIQATKNRISPHEKYPRLKEL